MIHPSTAIGGRDALLLAHWTQRGIETQPDNLPELPILPSNRRSVDAAGGTTRLSAHLPGIERSRRHVLLRLRVADEEDALAHGRPASHVSIHSKSSSGYGHHARSRDTLREYKFPRVRLEPREALTRAYSEAALTPSPRPILRWSLFTQDQTRHADGRMRHTPSRSDKRQGP